MHVAPLPLPLFVPSGQIVFVQVTFVRMVGADEPQAR